ncbi:MAG TPA: zf-HC2 domain-containing protein [Acidimicrobiales bacterium]|nr:zf-HC2 domain-containing protein [Acidimicrobiales bacterium]
MSPGEHTPSEWLSALIDDELQPAEAAAVGAHVAQCRDCADEAARFGRARAALRSAAVPALPADWEERLVGTVRSADRGAIVAMRRRVAATAAAVAALVAAAVFSFVPHDPTASPSVGRMIVSHATSSGAGDPSRLAPAAVTASFGGR